MKKLVIILAIVGVSFFALLVYGVSRDQPAGPTKEDCGNLPKGDDLDEDDFEDWCPPPLAESTRPLQARFAPDLGIKPVTISNSSLAPGQFSVAKSDERARAARIELVQGDFAILRGSDDAKLCLCKPHTSMNSKLFEEDACAGRWQAQHLDPKEGQPRLCRSGDESGVLPFLEDGGWIRLLSGPPATVRIE